MTHGEKWLIGHALWTALVAVAIWLTCRIGRQAAVEDAENRGWTEALAEVERNAIVATLVKETAGYPDLPAQTQVTAAGFDVYRQTHTTYAELAPEVLGAADVPRPDPAAVGQWADGPGHPHPDDWGDDTAVEEFRRWGSWEEQLAAIDASLGDSPWWTARQREMAA